MGGGWFGQLVYGWYRTSVGYARSLAGSLPAQTGVLTRVYAALRSVAGSLPAQTGTLTRSAFVGARTLAGSLPSPTGVLAAVKVYGRSADGSLPSPTGALTRTYGAVRSLAGSLPAMTGELFHGSTTARGAQGNLPAATGVLTRGIHATTRALAGVFGFDPVYGAHSVGALAGGWYSQLASPSGILTRTINVSKSLAGAFTIATGALTRVASQTWPTISGSLPAATGVLTRTGGESISLAGNLPAMTGVLFVASHQPLRRVVEGAAEVVQMMGEAAIGVLTSVDPSFGTGTVNGQAFGALVSGWYAPVWSAPVMATASRVNVNAPAFGGMAFGWYAPTWRGISGSPAGSGSAGTIEATVTVDQPYAIVTRQ